MKPVVMLLALAVAISGSAEEKKVNPRAFRMPSKKVQKKAQPPEPVKKVEQPEAVKPEPAVSVTMPQSVEPAPAAAPVPPVEPQPPIAPALPAAEAPATPAESPTAFRLPIPRDAEPAPDQTGAVEKPAKQTVRDKPKAASPAFTLPGSKPAPAKKKNPVTFRMPAKKSE